MAAVAQDQPADAGRDELLDERLEGRCDRAPPREGTDPLGPRVERISAFAWRRPVTPTLESLVEELVASGVSRLVLSHGGHSPDAALLESLVRRHDADILVAGGATDLDGVRRLRDAGIAGVILGEALLSGAIDFPRALEAAA